MIIFFKKTFLKELAKLPPDLRTEMEELFFEKLIFGDTIEQYKIERMKGYRDRFQIRTGNLRFGFTFDCDKNKIICERIAHRTNIYKLFPFD
jgi:mRNA interferase RelE/StbE